MRVSQQPWRLRDVLPLWAVLTAAGVCLSSYVISLNTRPAPRPVAVTPPPVDAAKRYSGSILLHERGEDCWQRMLDNRTGQLWDVGKVSCVEAMLPVATERQATVTGADRMRAIGKAFRSED